MDGELTGYNLANGKLNYDNVLCFYQDSNGQLWIGTQGGGLSRYDEKADRLKCWKLFICFQTTPSIQ